jgi:hypothetical protein
VYQDLARHCSIGYTVVQTLCTVSHSRAYTVSSVQLSLLQKRERERGRKQFPPAREFWHLTQGSVMQKDDSLAFTVFKKKEPFFFPLSLSNFHGDTQQTFNRIWYEFSKLASAGCAASLNN